MSRKKPAKEFNYAVGHYWEEGSGAVGVYNYFGEVHHGTMEEAVHLLNYVKEKYKKEPKANRPDWRIFQLIEIPT